MRPKTTHWSKNPLSVHVKVKLAKVLFDPYFKGNLSFNIKHVIVFVKINYLRPGKRASKKKYKRRPKNRSHTDESYSHKFSSQSIRPPLDRS